MKKFDFTVRCSDPAARHRPAKYKIAAEWIGGGFRELKTFGFADDECLEAVLRSAQERAARIKLSEGELLGEVHVYLLDPSKHDYDLEQAAGISDRLNLKSETGAIGKAKK